jgi:hypothetical protein
LQGIARRVSRSFIAMVDASPEIYCAHASRRSMPPHPARAFVPTVSISFRHLLASTVGCVSGSETLLRIQSLAGYIIGTLEYKSSTSRKLSVNRIYGKDKRAALA